MERNPNPDFLSALCQEALADPGTGLRAILTLPERHLRADVGKTICWQLPLFSGEDMEEVWQETLTETWDSLRQGKVPQDIHSWVWTTAYHRAIDLLRHKDARTSAEGDVVASHGEVVEADPAAEIMQQEGRAAIARQLNERIAELPSDQQMLLKMHFWEGRKYREIAEALGLPAGTVRSRLSRILSRLRECLRIAPEDIP